MASLRYKSSSNTPEHIMLKSICEEVRGLCVEYDIVGWTAMQSTGKIINADINGALNILRKCKSDDWIINLLSNSTCIGFLFNPVRVRL